ncbi:hypothetical protein B0H19DRAFT_1147886 [Mycena capillaripes]|nr:hypothetical protein B0H19DRAFT_1147886 [Mycena capillaripes]
MASILKSIGRTPSFMSCPLLVALAVSGLSYWARSKRSFPVHRRLRDLLPLLSAWVSPVGHPT